MKRISRKAFWILGLPFLAFDVAASIQVESSPITWSNGVKASECSFIFSTVLPLSQPKTLIVDNNLPNATVLYSWGYSDFIPNIVSACGAVSDSSPVNSISVPLASATTMLMFYGFNSSLLAGQALLPTSNPGVGLKVYYQYAAKGTGNTGLSKYSSTQLNPDIIGVETPINTSLPIFVNTFYPITNNSSPPYIFSFSPSANYSILMMRGELIKVGQVTESSGLQLSSNPTIGYTFSNGAAGAGGSNINLNEILGGGGINIVHPTCQLRGSTDYQVNLGSWESASSSSLPAYSEAKPVDINIECSGKLNNVEFSFQDSGSSSLSNRNISVYDSIGGQPINGLEIEMSYAGTRIDVHKISESPTSYKINTGSHGSVKTNPTDTSFNSQSQAQFEARFVQRAAITRGGSSYAGPVTGQVNMFITYN